MSVSGVRVLGSCYVCGRPVRGQHATLASPDYITKGGAYRDEEGIRHGGCSKFPRPGTVNPAQT